MGKSDVALKVWLGNPVRFADLFNAVLFDGEQVIDASQLVDNNIEYGMIVTDKTDSKKALQSYRDIVMIWNDEVTLAILACENQNSINYGMPVRNMIYDGLEYSEQIKQIKNKIKEDDHKVYENIPDIYYSRELNIHKLTPVITLVVYYGDEEWDAPIELYDMLDIDSAKEDAKLLNALQKYVPNYKINLVIPWKIADYNVFTTDLHMIFHMLKYKKNRVKLNEFVSEYSDFFRNIPDDTLDVIKILLKTGKRFDKKIEQLKISKEDEEGSTDFMCIFDEIYEDGVAYGIEQGIEEGKIQILLEEGYTVFQIAKRLNVKVEDVEKVIVTHQ